MWVIMTSGDSEHLAEKKSQCSLVSLVVVEKTLEWPTYPGRYDAITSRTGVLGEIIAQPVNSLLSLLLNFSATTILKS